MGFSEWVSTIDNASSIFMAGMMLIQTIFIGAGFWFGMRYLEQHREKVKEEKNLSLIYDTLNLMRKYRLLVDKAYGVPIIIGKKIDQAEANAKDLILEWFCYLRDNYKNERELIIETEALIRTNFDLIGRQNLSKKWTEVVMSLKILELNYLSHIHTVEFERDIRIVELFQTQPRSIISNKHGHLIIANRIYRELVKEMIDLYKS